MKQQPGGDIMMYGFGPVAYGLLEHGLLDEFHLAVNPTMAGTGGLDERLFQPGGAGRFELIGTQVLTSGVAVLSCRPEPRQSS